MRAGRRKMCNCTEHILNWVGWRWVDHSNWTQHSSVRTFEQHFQVASNEHWVALANHVHQTSTFSSPDHVRKWIKPTTILSITEQSDCRTWRVEECEKPAVTSWNCSFSSNLHFKIPKYFIYSHTKLQKASHLSSTVWDIQHIFFNYYQNCHRFIFLLVNWSFQLVMNKRHPVMFYCFGSHSASLDVTTQREDRLFQM